jgi:hypothetical protein
MSRSTCTRRLAAAALLLACAREPGFAQEQIIRVLPDDGTAGVQAQWRTPRQLPGPHDAMRSSLYAASRA